MVIGSTEKHYTASKIFQSILSKHPVFSIFHTESSALEILKECKANAFTVEYSENFDKTLLKNQIEETFYNFITKSDDWQPNLDALGKYSAKQSAKKLVEAIEKIK